jgi:hypothetical protein
MKLAGNASPTQVAAASGAQKMRRILVRVILTELDAKEEWIVDEASPVDDKN